MDRAPEQPALPARHGQSSVAWYQAATLAERLACWSDAAAAHLLDKPGRDAEADRIVQQWKAQQPFDSGTFFADRLAMDHLTECDLLALLAEPSEALAQRLGSPCAPDWVRDLEHVRERPAPSPVPEQDRERFAQQFALLHPFFPLLHASLTALQEGITALARQTLLRRLTPTRCSPCFFLACFSPSSSR